MWLKAPTTPLTRGECPTERPCPHLRCRYHHGGVGNEPGGCALDDADLAAARVREPSANALEARRSRRKRGLVDPDYSGHTEAMSLREVGDRLGVSRERVRQIQDEALRKVRRAMRL